MTKQEQIAKMEKIINEMYNSYATTAKEIAEELYNAGYQKALSDLQSDTQKKFKKKHSNGVDNEIESNSAFCDEKCVEFDKLKSDNQMLIEALQYMAGMYGLRVSRTKLDDEIEYSCNNYVIDEKTWDVLKRAEEMICWWE